MINNSIFIYKKKICSSDQHLDTRNAESVEAGEEIGLVSIFVESVEAYIASEEIAIIMGSGGSHRNNELFKSTVRLSLLDSIISI